MSNLTIGALAPDFSLPAHPEGKLTLSEQRGRWVILYFYPKDNTPGCTTEACQFRDAHSEFASADALVIGVSRDSLRSHSGFARKFDLPFALVGDEDESLCNLYEVMKEKTMYGKLCRGIERSTFLIDPDGRFAAIWRKVKAEGHAAEVLATLRALTS